MVPLDRSPGPTVSLAALTVNTPDHTMVPDFPDILLYGVYSRHLLLAYHFKYWCIIFTFTLNVSLVTLCRLPHNIRICA